MKTEHKTGLKYKIDKRERGAGGETQVWVENGKKHLKQGRCLKAGKKPERHWKEGEVDEGDEVQVWRESSSAQVTEMGYVNKYKTDVEGKSGWWRKTGGKTEHWGKKRGQNTPQKQENTETYNKTKKTGEGESDHKSFYLCDNFFHMWSNSAAAPRK